MRDTNVLIPTVTNHPSTNPSYVEKHGAAFRDLAAPSALTTSDRVWIADHYYPGLVVGVGDDGHAVVSTPRWDYDTDAPMVRGGKLVEVQMTYRPSDYYQLRVDPVSAEFWPAPSGWVDIEA